MIIDIKTGYYDVTIQHMQTTASAWNRSIRYLLDEWRESNVFAPSSRHQQRGHRLRSITTPSASIRLGIIVCPREIQNGAKMYWHQGSASSSQKITNYAPSGRNLAGYALPWHDDCTAYLKSVIQPVHIIKSF